MVKLPLNNDILQEFRQSLNSCRKVREVAKAVSGACARHIHVVHPLTPVSNTGSDSQNDDDDNKDSEPSLECWVDYLQGTIHTASLQAFYDCVEFVIQCRSDAPINYDTGKPIFAGIVWQNSIQSANGVKVGYNIKDDGGVHAWFSMPGGYFHQMDALDHWRVFRGLYYKWSFKCNRVDWKIRDFSRRVTPTQVYQYAKDGYVRLVRKYEISGSGSIGSDATMTTYLGSRQSEKFLRVYDAKPVHNVDAIDWELQCRDEKAQVSFQSFVGIECYSVDDDGKEHYDSEITYDLVAKFIAGNICGAVDFVDGVDKNISRCKRLEWWQQFCDECGGRLRLPSGRKSTSIQKTKDWLERQVFVVMSALQEGYGQKNFMAWLQSRLEAAKRRYNSYHEGIVYLCKQVRQEFIADLEVSYG